MAASLRPTSRRLVVYAFILLLLFVASPRRGRLAAGAAIVTAGLAVRVWATGYLHKNQKLTTQGPYAYVRHPLYAGTLLSLIGFGVAASGAGGAAGVALSLVLAVGLAVFFFYYLPYKARLEADRCLRRFGSTAERYLREVPNLLPFRRPFRGEPAFWSLRQVLVNNEHWTCLAAGAGLAILWAKMRLT